MNNKIGFTFWEPQYKPFYSTALEINNSKRFIWIQRLFLWLAKKVGAKYYAGQSIVEYNEIRIDGNKIKDIWEQIKYVKQCGGEPSCLIIGAYNYNELIEEVHNWHQLKNQVCFAFDKFLGLRVIIVPWINGMFVMEKPEFMVLNNG